MVRSSLLLSNAIERGLVVEAKITSVNNVVGTRSLGKLVQGSEVAWRGGG